MDNPQIAHQASGIWHSAKSELSPYISFLKWNVHALQRLWKFNAASRQQHLIQSRPRSRNLTSEDLAIGVEKSGEALLQTCVVQLFSNDMLVLSS